MNVTRSSGVALIAMGHPVFQQKLFTLPPFHHASDVECCGL